MIKIKNSISASCFLFGILLVFCSFAINSNKNTTALIKNNSDYIKIYFENKCDKSVKYEAKYSGHGFSGSISANSKRPITIRPTAKVYIDGNYYREVSKSDDREVWVICK